MKDIKVLKRKLKEVKLYATFILIEKQANKLNLHEEYVNLCEELIENNFLKEFFEIITNVHTPGLEAFVNFETNDFRHVLNFMKCPHEKKCIMYYGDYITYSNFLVFKENDKK